MAGKKGRSGRKGWEKTLELKKLWDLSVPVLKHALVNPNIKQEKKIEIALFLVGKMTPKDIDMRAEGLNTIVHNIIKYGGNEEKAMPVKENSRIAKLT